MFLISVTTRPFSWFNMYIKKYTQKQKLQNHYCPTTLTVQVISIQPQDLCLETEQGGKRGKQFSVKVSGLPHE